MSTLAWKIDDLIGMNAMQFSDHIASRSRIYRRAQIDMRTLSDLCSLSQIDDILARQSLAFPMVRCVSNGQRLTPELFTVPSGVEDEAIRYIDTEKLFRCFKSGASIVVRDMHRYCAGLADVSWALSEDLGCAVTVNGYLTPIAQQAFKPHFDYHDIIVVQIHGTKRWIEYDSNAYLPLDDNNWRSTPGSVNPALPGVPKVIREDILGPGDVLFVPRGGSHAVVSQDDASFHVTFELQQWTKYDVVSTALGQIFDTPVMRESLSFRSRDRGKPIDRKEFEESTRSFALAQDELNLSDIGWSLQRKSHVDMRETPVQLMSQYSAFNMLDENTTVRRRANILYQIRRTELAIELRTRHRATKFPLRAEQALIDMLSGQPHTATEVARSDGLSVPEALQLVQVLVGDATLVPA